MRHEAEVEAEEAGAEFKANVFANSPKLYYDLFEKEQIDPEEPIIFPENPAEFHSMMLQMKRDKVIS